MKRKARSNKRIFIYFRYIFPIAAAVTMIALMFVPSYCFTTADTGLNDAVSLWELLGNSWNTAREYLFGSGEKLDVTLSFAKILIAVIVVLVTLFVMGVAFAVYEGVCAFRYFASGKRDSKGNIVFITLVPNRIMLCVYNALALPLFLLPRIMPLLYQNVLAYYVEVTAAPFDMIFIALTMYAVSCIAVAVSSGYERAESMDIFEKRAEYEDSEDEEQAEEIESDDPYERMSQKEKAEQTERILRLLENYRQNDQDRKDKDEDGE